MGDGEAVNSSGGPQRAGTVSVLFMKLQPRPGSRLPGVMEGGRYRAHGNRKLVTGSGVEGVR